MTPLDKVEVLYQHLVYSYEGAQDAEVRAASKLLMVALCKIKESDRYDWFETVQEYIDILRNDPAKFERFVDQNRSHYQEEVLILPVRHG